MIDVFEYRDYMNANQELLSMLKEKQSLLYDRLQDVLKVIEYIDVLLEQYQNIEEEYEVFYETGFPFLYNQIEEIKIYYNNYFQRDYKKLQPYESLINYTLYLDDYKECLKEAELLNDDIMSAIDDIQNQIEEILTNKLSYRDDIFDKFNAILISQIKFKIRILTTTEVFERIVEELVL